MKKEILFEAIGEIDDDIIENSDEIPKARGKLLPFALAAAACLVLVAVGVIFLPMLPAVGGGSSAETATMTEGAVEGPAEETCKDAVEEFYAESSASTTEVIPEEGDTESDSGNADIDLTGGLEANGTSPAYIHYNHYREVSVTMADRLPGFREELSAEELEAVLPQKLPESLSYTAVSEHSYEDGRVWFLRFDYSTAGGEGQIFMSEYGHSWDCIYNIPDSAKVSLIGGREFRVCSYEPGDGTVFVWAETEINSVTLYFEFTYKPGNDGAREEFNELLRSFALYGDGKPDLSKVTYEYLPEYINESPTRAEAYENEHFGAYLPTEIPGDFGEEYFHYSKFSVYHSLSAIWSRDLDDISWVVTYYDPKAYAGRLVDVKDTEKYDLNLYPIPWSESVPEELWETVTDPVFDISDITPEAVEMRCYYVEDLGDVDGPRISFNVLAGDRILQISTKGVSPKWVYDSLMDIYNRTK